MLLSSNFTCELAPGFFLDVVSVSKPVCQRYVLPPLLMCVEDGILLIWACKSCDSSGYEVHFGFVELA